ncbi:nucleotide exchange factor GrpE [Clostridioides mangenotii]|uniref:nucleotide exchange factor GrpE n=1 Tax=Metaclostridioides mangenotii TaxID=1540 RepID=UPI001C11F239|nr:nucleotide exchange factor GrpE [Clostridioides mangenotii]MBU5307693.1 nucleotide exchange factor GrpE [Clostridioides mangenotii]MCR1954814.1 nucleotide exchange factor GrpE [Clostridioides mangenotii]
MDNKKQQQDEEVLEKDDLVDNKSVDSSTDNDTAQSEDTVEGDNVTDINSKIDEKKLKDELDELTDNYQRLQAEYANYRRRTQQEKDSLSLFANEKIMTELIPVIDSMERALDACEDKDDSMYKGIDLVHKQLIDTLSKLGLEHIEALDQEFDPNYHLAVMQENVEGIEPNKVVMELQKGYKLGEKVIRASMVKVSC